MKLHMLPSRSLLCGQAGNLKLTYSLLNKQSVSSQTIVWRLMAWSFRLVFSYALTHTDTTAFTDIYSSHCISLYSVEEQTSLWFQLSLLRAKVRLKPELNTVADQGPPQRGRGSTCCTARPLPVIIWLFSKGRGFVLIYNLRTKLFTLFFHSSRHVLRNVFTFNRIDENNNHVYLPSADKS